jgi:hypothetical protein
VDLGLRRDDGEDERKEPIPPSFSRATLTYVCCPA